MREHGQRKLATASFEDIETTLAKRLRGQQQGQFVVIDQQNLRSL